MVSLSNHPLTRRMAKSRSFLDHCCSFGRWFRVVATIRTPGMAVCWLRCNKITIGGSKDTVVLTILPCRLFLSLGGEGRKKTR